MLMARQGQAALLQLLPDELPSAHLDLLVDGRDATRVDPHVGQLEQVALALNGLDELLGRRRTDEDAEELVDAFDAGELGIGEQVPCELEDAFADLRGAR